MRSIIDSNGGEKAGVEAITMELGDLSSVKNAAKEFMSRSESLNVLVCNAGKQPSIRNVPDGLDVGLN